MVKEEDSELNKLGVFFLFEASMNLKLGSEFTENWVRAKNIFLYENYYF